MSCPFRDPNKTCFILGSYPRSGNTMVRHCLEHYFHIQTWSDGPATALMRTQAPGSLRLQQYPNAKIHAQKSHTPRRSGKTPALIIVRDPRDVTVSFAHFNREILEVKNVPIQQEFRQRAMHKAWSSFYTYWLHQRHLGGIEVIRYEDTVEHIKNGTVPEFFEGVLKALGIEAEVVTRGPMPSFSDYHKARPKFYRRGVAGGWRDELTPEVAEACWKTHGQVAKTFGYTADGSCKDSM